MLATRAFWLLLALFAVIVAARVHLKSVRVDDVELEQVFTFVEELSFRAAPGPFSLSVYIPRANSHIQLIDESFEPGSLTLGVEDLPEGRRIRFEGPAPREPLVARYRATVRSLPISYSLSSALTWADITGSDPRHLQSTDLIQADHAEVQGRLAELLDLEQWFRDSGEAALDVAAWRSELRARDISPVDAVQAIFDHCQHQIESAKFSGSTDALTALRLGHASCGGKSRLMAAMCRAIGIPTATIGGVILTGGTRKRTSHVWIECQLAGEWVPFDPLNDHFASIPTTYLTLYHGDRSLIQHSRGLSFDYAFVTDSEQLPRAWLRDGAMTSAAAGTTEGVHGRIPLLRQQAFSLLVLSPFALLAVLFLRQVVGIDSMGVFLPVLLGFSITEAGWLLGGGQIVVALLVGIALRFSMVRLNLLYVPRTASMITVMVVTFLIASVVLEKMHLVSPQGALLLPLAALAMTVERYTLVAMDRGHRDAGVLVAQTFGLGVVCHIVMTTALLKSLVVSFPEILLVVLAELIVIGNYRGLRLREKWRFRAVNEVAS